MDTETTTLYTALLQVQKNLKAAKKTAKNPYFKSKYADLGEVLEVCKEALKEQGLFLLQPCGKDALGHFVKTSVVSESGASISSTVYLTEPQDMQKLGSAITYARRYGLVSLLALEVEDDDAESAVGRGISSRVAPSQPGPEDGIQSNSYQIPYGPLAKQPIDEADPKKLRDYILDIEKKAKTTGKPLPVWAKELITHATPLIAEWENSFDNFERTSHVGQ